MREMVMGKRDVVFVPLELVTCCKNEYKQLIVYVWSPLPLLRQLVVGQ